MTLEVFGEDGGHAGENENAFMLAIDPALVHKGRYTGPEMTTANPAAGTWSAYPSPSSIGLYKEGQGFPKFDPVEGEGLLRSRQRQGRGARRGDDQEVGPDQSLTYP